MKYQIKNAAITIEGNTILNSINFEITDNNHIGIVGRNGEGKTTLLKALIDNEMLEEGLEDEPLEIIKPSKLTIGCLEQITFKDENISLIEEIKSSFKEVVNIEKRIEQLLKKIETENKIEDIEEYTKLLDKYKYLGGYTYKKEYETILKKLGFTENDKEKKISSFSGGEKTKLAFIKLLLSKPDILLLDEPTNHLDLDTIIWLEKYLNNYKKAIIIVSHDRMFLNNTVNIIYDISHKKLVRYKGNYEQYEKQKQANYEKQLADYEREQKEIKRLQTIYEKYRYKPTKAKMALSKLHQIERMEKIEKPLRINEKSFKIDLNKMEKSGRVVLTAKDLVIGYDHPLATINLEIIQGRKIGVIGSNGTGKSTLLKTINQLIKPLSGKISYGYNVKIAYFDQNLKMHNINNTILEEFLEEHQDETENEARKILGAFLFSGEDVNKKIEVLSGGEKVRLQLCKILYNKPNFLILDEATNHLDIIGKSRIEKILEEYKGTIIFVSHDRYFVKKIATSLIVFSNNQVKYYQYGYDEYINKINQKEDKKEVQKEEVKKNIKKPNNKQNEKELAKIERELEKLEKKKEELTEKLYDPEIYNNYEEVNKINTKLTELEQAIKEKEQNWEKLASTII